MKSLLTTLALTTALMVLGVDAGATIAEQRGLDALFLVRYDSTGIHGKAVGRLFLEQPSKGVSGLDRKVSKPS